MRGGAIRYTALAITSRDAQEQYPTRRGMVNVADPIMGGAYDNFVRAFGADVAWVLGHLAILVVLATLISVMRNWLKISEGAQLNRSHALDAFAIVLFTAIQTHYFFHHPRMAPFTSRSDSRIKHAILAMVRQRAELKPSQRSKRPALVHTCMAAFGDHLPCRNRWRQYCPMKPPQLCS